LNIDGISETVLFAVGVGHALKSHHELDQSVYHDYSHPLPSEA